MKDNGDYDDGDNDDDDDDDDGDDDDDDAYILFDTLPYSAFVLYIMKQYTEWVSHNTFCSQQICRCRWHKRVTL